MTDITQLSEQVITAIRQTEEYITYHRLLDELKTDPVVFARVRELQRQNFEIQNSDCADMLAKAKAEYNTLRGVAMHGGNNDIEDTSPSFKTVEDDGANQLSKEETGDIQELTQKM